MNAASSALDLASVHAIAASQSQLPSVTTYASTAPSERSKSIGPIRHRHSRSEALPYTHKHLHLAQHGAPEKTPSTPSLSALPQGILAPPTQQGVLSPNVPLHQGILELHDLRGPQSLEPCIEQGVLGAAAMPHSSFVGAGEALQQGVVSAFGSLQQGILGGGQGVLGELPQQLPTQPLAPQGIDTLQQGFRTPQQGFHTLQQSIHALQQGILDGPGRLSSLEATMTATSFAPSAATTLRRQVEQCLLHAAEQTAARHAAALASSLVTPAPDGAVHAHVVTETDKRQDEVATGTLHSCRQEVDSLTALMQAAEEARAKRDAEALAASSDVDSYDDEDTQSDGGSQSECI